MGSFGNYLELALLDHVFGKTVYTAPTTIYMALFISVPSDSGGGTEVSAGDYARLGITNNTTNFPAAASGSKTNGTDFAFGVASSSWGTVTSVGFFDASSSGNLLAWGTVAANKTISSGDTATFLTGEITITLD